MPLWDFALFENGQARSMSEMAIYRQLTTMDAVSVRV
jgi:hypothetical protein